MLKRTLTMALILALSVCAFASCELILGYDAAKLVAAADEALKDAEYTVNTTVVFNSENADMKAAISDLDGTSMTFERKGHGSRSTVSMNLGGALIEKEYLVTAGVLYYTHTEAYGENVETVKEKVTLNADEKAAVAEDVGMSAPLSYSDFDDVKVESSSNVHLITCKAIKADAASAIAASVKSSLGIEGADVTVSEAELKIRLVDGKYNGEYLSITYSVEIGGTVYDLVMQLSREYDVTTPVEISAPADAESYVKTTYAELTK